MKAKLPASYVVCRGVGSPGPLVAYTNACWPGCFRIEQTPPAKEHFCYVVPLLGIWRINKENCGSEPHFTHFMDDETIQAIRRNGRVLFDISNEGPMLVAGLFESIHEWSSATNIPLDRIGFLSQNRAIGSHYMTRYGQTGLTFLIFDSFIVQLFKLAQLHAQLGTEHFRPHKDNYQDKHDKFICLNYSPRPHRILTMLFLLKNGLLRDGAVSFAGLTTEKHEFSPLDLGDAGNWSIFQELMPYLAQLSEIGRLQIVEDVPDQTAGGNALAADLAATAHRNAFFSVVTETEMTSGEVSRITEKSIKPLFAGLPAIVLGNPHSLTLMRELGFQTWHPFINETYDNIIDSEQRFRAATQEIIRLCDLTKHNLAELIRRTEQINSFNRNFIQDSALDHYFRIFVIPILSWCSNQV